MGSMRTQIFRMTLSGALCLLATAGATSPAPATAGAAPASPLRQVVDRVETTIDPALVRHGGRLHLLWADPKRSRSVLHRTISVSGSLGPIHTVFTYNQANGDVNGSTQLLRSPQGLRALFAGTGAPGVRGWGLSTASSADGSSWSVHPDVISHHSGSPGAKVYAAEIGGALGLDGTVFSIWGHPDPAYHVGLNGADPDGTFDSPGTTYSPNVGVDAISGQVVAAWRFLQLPGAGGRSGVAVQSLSPRGPAAEIASAPADDYYQRLGITGRIGRPGIYVAHQRGPRPFNSRPALSRVAAPTRVGPALVVPGASAGAENVGIAAAPEGRLWVFWQRRNDESVFAARTNRNATRFGPIARARVGTRSVHRLVGEGSTGPLDLLVSANRGSGTALHLTRLLPGLSLGASPATLAAGKQLTLSVRDAGDPVTGARVRLRLGATTLQGTTAANGTVKLTVPAGTRPGRYTATATRAGYTQAVRTVRVV
jgi:hypothetical protein